MVSKKKLTGHSCRDEFHPSNLVTPFKYRNSLQLNMVQFTTTGPNPIATFDLVDDNIAQETLQQQDVKVGVLLLNLGGPEKTQDVEGGCERWG